MGDALLAQEVPLAGAGRGENFGADGLGNLDGGLAHAASRGMNEDTFPRLQLRQLHQAIPGGQESKGDGGRFPIANSVRNVGHLGGGQGKVIGKRTLQPTQSHHPVTHGKVGDAGPHGCDNAGTLKAQAHGLRLGNAEHSGIILLQQPQRIQHIPEI